jgi:uncharacterized glyoxalase superfamily protein PhnB
MNTTAKNTKCTIVPALRYRDCNAAIDWLCEVLGFEKQMVFPDESGQVVHAQLTFGNGMIMLGPVADTPFGRMMQQPDKIGLCETQAPYLVVADADAVYARAKKAGAKIELDIKDEDYGGRGFTCRDPEGHLWNVGTYDPWG